ncbi:hypothetical protein BU15DRAFT_20288, partial [Melanogaster broomeanus]
FWPLTAYIRDLQKVWVDGVVDESRWKTYISNLKSDWDSYTLYSTVMLAVDVSFLAAPVVQSGTPNSDSIRYLIYGSIIFSVGTIMVSVNLANQIRKFDVDSAFGAVHYLASMASGRLRVKQLAVMFMLPPLLLQW